MARRSLRFLGAVVLTAAIYTVVSVLVQSARVVAATEPLRQSQGADAGGPSTLARPYGATPGPSGASTPGPGARARPDGTPAAPGRHARPEGDSLRQAHGRAMIPRSHAQPGGLMLPRSHAQPGGSSTLGARARPGGARPASASTAGAHADGASPPTPCPNAGKEHHDHHHHHCHCHWHNYPAAGPPPPRTAGPPPPRTAGPPPPPRTAGPPPPRIAPPPPRTNERSTINRSMLVIGCLYSLLFFCNPMIVFWSTGRSMAATDAFCVWSELIASALSSLGWLLFALSQLHGEGGKINGTTGVVVNAIGFALYAAYLVAKLFVRGYMRTRDCIWLLLSFFGSYVIVVLVAVYGPMQSKSKTAQVISVVAFLLQIISQVIPLVTVWPLLLSMMHPPQIAQRPEHINSRKLTVFSRVGSFGLSLFWVSYCSMTYEHDYFQLANDIGAAMSFLSMILHLVYTLHPHDVDYPPAP